MAHTKVNSKPELAKTMEMKIVKARIPWNCAEVLSARARYRSYNIQIYQWSRLGRIRYQANIYHECGTKWRSCNRFDTIPECIAEAATILL